MWLFCELARMSLPVPVTRIRLEMPFWVLILGTFRGLLGGALGGRLRGGLPAWRQDHEQVLALEQRGAFDDGELLRVVRDPVENPPPDVLVDHLAAPEHDRHLNFLSCFEELLLLLELGDVLLAAMVLLLLDRLELVPSVVDQPADRRARLRRHFDEVESLLACDARGGVGGEEPQL